MKLLALAAVLISSASAQAAENACPARKTAILVDRTVANNAAVTEKLGSVLDRLLGEAQKAPKSFFNQSVLLSVIDDQGEHASQWAAICSIARFPLYEVASMSSLSSSVPSLHPLKSWSLRQTRCGSKIRE